MAQPKAGPSRRLTDRRRARTREALLSAGRALFAARDVDGVSVDEIVEAAEVAKGSFYNHFTDKDVFAREIAAAVRRQVEQAVNDANKDIDDPAEHLARALCVFAHFAIEHPDSARVLWRLNSGATMVDAPINRGLRDVVHNGIRSQRFRHVDLESGVLLVMGVIVIVLRHVLEERLVTPPHAVAANMAAGLLRAMGIANAQAARLSAAAANDLLQSA
ncbi:AcrR family transcriptional regulator [Povalibacter uvarum]|uniref:AcrR family transcriptional regulator n=1 Tax=Povalibacter uvarum TaxID=732238 RepID=A0A841HNV3_9GAMM|nr:TetR/AcrR family transcriptional regulator [Povalibacter uvarum]MBB6093818.1 AcrR family transcriptional regulator [Povalibacter uvarum]